MCPYGRRSRTQEEGIGSISRLFPNASWAGFFKPPGYREGDHEQGGKMTARERIEEIIRELNPKLEELSDGYVQFLGYDETKGILTVVTYGGRLL